MDYVRMKGNTGRKKNDELVQGCVSVYDNMTFPSKLCLHCTHMPRFCMYEKYMEVCCRIVQTE